jgi:hypothetical protein
MTAGGIGNGLSYWATINIKGDLDKDELNAVIKQIKDTLKGKIGGKNITGELVDAARLSNVTAPKISAALNKAPNKSGT